MAVTRGATATSHGTEAVVSFGLFQIITENGLWLVVTLEGFGVRLNHKTLEVDAGSGKFAIKKHNLVQAMLTVNDLFFLAHTVVESVFSDDVIHWLESTGIRYIGNVKFTGQSGFDHRFDFVIPRSETHSERILKVINRLTRDSTQSPVFS